MYKKNIYIVEFKQLFLILNEINNFLNYSLKEIDYKGFLKENFNNKNSLFLLKNSKFLDKKNLNLQNNLIFDDLPININKLIEKINIFFLKSVYQSNSQIYFKDYILNLNNKTIFLNKKKLKLAEKEVKIILFLLSEKTPQKTSVLQKKIWGYSQDSETHTVETHIYRLRKKIKNHFNDATFLKKNKNGYLL
tara:strand:- start:805 stop:1380 length:576 start_codon:yes stop_codon:yes gene_type:complete